MDGPISAGDRRCLLGGSLTGHRNEEQRWQRENERKRFKSDGGSRQMRPMAASVTGKETRGTGRSGGIPCTVTQACVTHTCYIL